MPDYSLVPVDYQPDFSNFSLVPVDYDPFSADGTVGALSQSEQPATGIGQPNVGAPANNAQAAAAAAGESYDPDSASTSGVPGSGQPYNPSAAPIPAPDKSTLDWSSYNRPFGELKPATYTPTQHIGNLVADALTALGMPPYTANDLTSRVGNVLGLTPLGVAGAALDLIDAKRRGDLGGAAVAAAGMIPGARGVARAGLGETLARGPVRAAESAKILAEELAGQTRSQIRELAADKGLVPKGDPLHPDYPRKWSDPVTNERRLRLDRGHVNSLTGRPFDNPNAAVDHVHAYDVNGNSIKVNGDRHIPTNGE